MDGTDMKTTGFELLRKYRYVFLVFLVGLFLMLMPESPINSSEPIVQETTPQNISLQDSLGSILSKIEGAGKTEVLLTEAAGEQTYYQSDEDISTKEQSKDQRRDTVVITNSSREETGLIRRIDPPVYQGAIVLCQGADHASVRLAIVEAVSNATGLSTDKITVLKMK